MQVTETEGLQRIHPYCNLSARWRGGRLTNVYELTVLTGTYDPVGGTVQTFDEDHALGLLHDCGLVISRRGLPDNRFQLRNLNTDLYALRTRWDQQVVPPQVHSDAPRRPSQLGSQFDPDTHTRIFINTGPANHYFFGIIPTLTGRSPTSDNALLIGTGAGFSHADFPLSEDAEAQTVSILAVRSLRMCGAHAPRVRRPDDDLWDALLSEYQTVVITYFPRTDEGRDREEVVSRCLDCRDELVSTSFRILQNHMEDYLSQQGPEGDDYLTCCDQRLSLLPISEEPPVLLHVEEYTADDDRARCRRVDNTLVLDIVWARWPGATAEGPIADHDFNIDDALSLLPSCGIKLRPSDVFDEDTDYAQMIVEQACDNWRHEYGGRPRSERPEELSSGASTAPDTTVWRPSTRAKITLDPSDKAGYTRVAVSRKEGTRAFTIFLPFTENSMSLDEEPVIYTEWPHNCKPTVSEKDFRLKFDQARGRTTLQARLRLRFCEHKENDRSARDPPKKLKALMLQRYKDVAGTHFQGGQGSSRDYATMSGDQIRGKAKTCYQDLIETGAAVLDEFIREDLLNGNLWTDIEIKGEHESPPSLDRLDGETLQGTKSASCDNFINLPWAYPTWYKIVTFPGTHAEITDTSAPLAGGGQSADGLAPPAARRRLRSSTGAIDTTEREGG